MIRFTIQYPTTKKGKAAFCRRFGLNAYYAGKSWKVRKHDAEELHLMARAAMWRAGIPREIISSPVRINFYWDDGLDIDNHAVIGKCFVDAMKVYILQDDRRKYLHRVSHEFWNKGEIGVEIEEIS